MDTTLHNSSNGWLRTAAQSDHHSALAKVICAWCKTIIREGSEPVSHGICEVCHASVKADSPNLSTHIEGPCARCQETTEAVMLWEGKAGFLCVPCQQKIREAA